MPRLNERAVEEEKKKKKKKKNKKKEKVEITNKIFF
jgi:hypothetical protein